MLRVSTVQAGGRNGNAFYGFCFERLRCTAHLFFISTDNRLRPAVHWAEAILANNSMSPIHLKRKGEPKAPPICVILLLRRQAHIECRLPHRSSGAL